MFCQKSETCKAHENTYEHIRLYIKQLQQHSLDNGHTYQLPKIHFLLFTEFYLDQVAQNCMRFTLHTNMVNMANTYITHIAKDLRFPIGK